MSTATRTPETRAHEFVAAVRDRLSDLSTDEADELTDGLAADLLDRLGDGGELGNPVTYADELRQAAGLPERLEPESERPRTLRERGHRIAEDWRGWWAATSGRRGIRDFALVLRPVWWMLRGLLVAQAVSWVLVVPLFTPLWLGFAAVAVLLSVQWGRGQWLWGGWGAWLRRIGSVIAIIALLPAMSSLYERDRYFLGLQESSEWTDPGLNLNGEGISNVFAYDCYGEPLDAVQLFAQDGRPLHTAELDPASSPGDIAVSGAGSRGDWVEFSRNAAAIMHEQWNVFPLREQAGETWDEAAERGERPMPQGEAPRLPYERVSALGACDTGTTADGESAAQPEGDVSEGHAADAAPQKNADPAAEQPADPADAKEAP